MFRPSAMGGLSATSRALRVDRRKQFGWRRRVRRDLSRNP